MKLPIITYPDKLLKTRSQNVTAFDQTLHDFLDDMFETMMESNGIGLAAIQVARPIRVLILCIPDEEGNQTQRKYAGNHQSRYSQSKPEQPSTKRDV